FTVSDNGVGLPAGFDLAKANTLGLKLVKNLVEQQLKGRLSVKRMKRGTRVTVEIPFDGVEAGAGGPSGAGVPPAGTGGGPGG
ncbi:MAG TPA: ATP-binding protein, partial [Methanomicrobiales archaeon]|nr:ATP-binding protein [Methanomicrobiales archaeon]